MKLFNGLQQWVEAGIQDGELGSESRMCDRCEKL